MNSCGAASKEPFTLLNGSPILRPNSRNPDVQTDITRVGQHILSRKKIMVVSGAGMSISAGIPDFRGKRGVFKKYKQTEQLYDCTIFEDPTKANVLKDYLLANDTLRSASYSAEPTPMHHFVASISTQRHYTQNIDGLETKLPGQQDQCPLSVNGPWPRTIRAHGCLTNATCYNCKVIYRTDNGNAAVPSTNGQAGYFTNRPTCPNCGNGEDGEPAGTLVPRLYLYHDYSEAGTYSPDDHEIRAAMASDLATDIDELIVIGCSLRTEGHIKDLVIAGLQKVKENGGCGIWINLDEPPKDVRNLFEVHLLGPCDTWAVRFTPKPTRRRVAPTFVTGVQPDRNRDIFPPLGQMLRNPGAIITGCNAAWTNGTSNSGVKSARQCNGDIARRRVVPTFVTGVQSDRNRDIFPPLGQMLRNPGAIITDCNAARTNVTSNSGIKPVRQDDVARSTGVGMKNLYKVNAALRRMTTRSQSPRYSACRGPRIGAVQQVSVSSNVLSYPTMPFVPSKVELLVDLLSNSTAQDIDAFLKAVASTYNASPVVLHAKALSFSNRKEKNREAKTHPRARFLDCFSSFTRKRVQGESTRVGLFITWTTPNVGKTKAERIKQVWHSWAVCIFWKNGVKGRFCAIFDPNGESLPPGQLRGYHLLGKTRAFLQHLIDNNWDIKDQVWIGGRGNRRIGPGLCLSITGKWVQSIVQEGGFPVSELQSRGFRHVKNIYHI